MQIPIVPIGNSKGIRLSKTILEKYEIHDKIELIMKKDHIELRPIKEVRNGWAEAFEKMNQRGEDQLIIDDIFEDEDLPQ